MGNQLTLDLALPPPTYAREDFVVADGNREALAWIDRWPDWPAPALSLSGPTGCGKTHLGRIWAARSGATVMTGRDLEGRNVADLTDLATASRAIMIDEAEGAPERGLFHLYNLMRERGGSLLLVSAEPPARWSIVLPDLASRLRAIPVVTLSAPDDELLRAVLVKLFADRQLAVDESLVSYLMARLERSFPAARVAVERLDREAIQRKRPVSRALAAELYRGEAETRS